MAIIASKYYPISDMFFRDGGVKPLDLIPGQDVIHSDEPHIIGLHVFNWGTSSWMTVETVTGQIIKFTATSLVEGAIYYLKINKLCNVGPTSTETQVMGISTSERI